MKNTPCLVLYSCFFALSFLNQVQAEQAILIK